MKSPCQSDLSRRLVHAIHVRRNIAFCHQPLAPTGQQDHWRLGRCSLDRARHFAPVHGTAREIGDHHREMLVAFLRRAESTIPAWPPVAVVTAWPSASNASRNDLISNGSSSPLKIAAAEASLQAGQTAGLTRNRHRESKPHRGSLPDFTLHLDVRAMPPHHAVDHGETQPGASWRRPWEFSPPSRSRLIAAG